MFEAQALGLPRPVAVVEDARRGEVYVQCIDGQIPEAPMLLDPSDLAVAVGDVALTGSAAVQISALTGSRVLAPAMPLAVAIARIAAAAAVPGPRPAPIYLRAPDATVPRAAPPAILT
jgi:tRNA A37 threonylcarbamoyladenosine modification protein TsaB